MTSWADNESALDRARELLADRYPHSSPAILETFDIAWSGWEADYMGALITVDGVPEIVIIDRFSGDTRPDIEQVREQLAEYRRLIVETERVLKRYSELSGTVDHVDMHGAEWQLQRDPGESDEDYAARRQLLLDGGLSPEVRELKWQITRAIVYATEAAGLFDQPAFLRALGMHEDWLSIAVEKPDSVPLNEYVRVYDAAAKRANWQPLHAIAREVTARQRFKEWP